MKNLTQEKLIKAGARAMLTKSYHAVGIQEILKTVGVPKGSFYYYFSSKEDFGVAIVEYYGQQISALLKAHLLAPECSPRHRLLNYFLSVKEYYEQKGCTQGCLVAKLATEVGSSSPEIRRALKEQFDAWTRLVSTCIIEAQVAGEINDFHNPELLAEFIYAAWEGALIRMQVNHDLDALDNFLKYVFEYLLPA